MAENKKYFYLKLKDNFFSSEEMLMLESLPDGLIYQNVYLRMCLLSLKNDGALTFKNMIPYDLNMLSTVLRIDISTVKVAIEIFEKLGLVEKNDNEVLFMADIQTLIGKSSTEAERIATYRKRIAGTQNEQISDNEVSNVQEISTNDVTESVTKSVQMLQSCTPEIEIELEKEIKQEQELNTENAHACNFSKQNNLQTENVLETPCTFQDVVKQCFEKIQVHNQNHSVQKRVPISRDFMTFVQKEGRLLAEYLKAENPETILKALTNYLKVADMDSWKTAFSFQAFCKNYIEYTDDYFAVEKFDKTSDPEEICQQFRNRMEQDNRFDVAEFLQHKKDWLALGRPDGEDYFIQQEKWYATDED